MRGFYFSELYVIGIIVFLVVDLLIAAEFQNVAEIKGFNGSLKYFWITFFLGIIGMLLVVALPDRAKKEEVSNELPDL